MIGRTVDDKSAVGRMTIVATVAGIRAGSLVGTVIATEHLAVLLPVVAVAGMNVVVRTLRAHDYRRAPGSPESRRIACEGHVLLDYSA